MYLTKSKRSPYYQLIYYRNGKRTTISTKKKLKSEALKFLNEFAREGTNPPSEKSPPLLSEFETKYIEDAAKSKSKSYLRSIQLSFRMLSKHIGNKSIEKIKPQEIDNFLSLVYERSRSASGLYFRTLKAAFSKAVLWDYIDNNPFKGVKSPKQVTSFPIFITIEELNLILHYTKHQLLKDLFITAFYSGMRLGELVNMNWAWIDLNEKLITIKNLNGFMSKSKRERVIPVHPKIQELLTHRFSNFNQTEFVFFRNERIKLNEDFVSKQFKKSVRLAGLSDDIHFHTLRHSFASNLVQKGVSLYIVKELLGHSSIITTQIYSHLNNDSLSEAVKLLTSE